MMGSRLMMRTGPATRFGMVPVSQPFGEMFLRHSHAFAAASVTFPCPSKLAKGKVGEDAAAASSRMLTVADGVGGWGAVAGTFSSKLVAELQLEAQRCPHGASLDALQALEAASSRTPHYTAKKKPTGSSTATVLCLNGSTINAINLGDSGFIILRPGAKRWEVLARTEPTLFAFNSPFQLGTGSDHKPSMGTRHEIHDIQKGDIVLAASDGLFDNLFEASIVNELKGSPDLAAVLDLAGIEGMQAEAGGLTATHGIEDPATIRHNDPRLEAALRMAASFVASAAVLLGKNQTLQTPFAVDAQNHGYNYTGGKPDDVSVVLAVVWEDPVAE